MGGEGGGMGLVSEQKLGRLPDLTTPIWHRRLGVLSNDGTKPLLDDPKTIRA